MSAANAKSAVGRPVVIEEIEGNSFTCSFCGRGAWSGLLEGTPCVVHELPPCETYVQLEPDEFVSACLQFKLARRSPTAARSSGSPH